VTRWWRPRSVRIRLTLWYVAAMAVVLALFAAGVYALLQHSLDEQAEAYERAAFHRAPLPPVEDVPDAELH
jgi:type VI protein secretion system component VasF